MRDCGGDAGARATCVDGMHDLGKLLRELVRRTNTYFQSGPGSANLLFANAGTAQQRDRNRRAATAAWELQRLRLELEKQAIPPLGPALGKYLYQRGFQSAVCVHKTSVFLHLCQQSSELGQLIDALYLVGTAESQLGDHAFAVVRERATASSPAQYGSIADMCQASTASGLWIGDAWAEVACPVQEYPGEIQRAAVLAQGTGLGVGASAQEAKNFDHMLWVVRVLQSAPEVHEYPARV